MYKRAVDHQKGFAASHPSLLWPLADYRYVPSPSILRDARPLTRYLSVDSALAMVVGSPDGIHLLQDRGLCFCRLVLSRAR